MTEHSSARVAALLLGPLLIGSSCTAPTASDQPPAPASAGTEQPRQQVTTGSGEYVIEYVSRPSPIPLNEPFEVDLWVFGPSGESRSDVDVRVDAAMPEHRHGMNREPQVERRSDGGFTARGLLLHMSGRWELYFDVTLAGATDRALLELVY